MKPKTNCPVCNRPTMLTKANRLHRHPCRRLYRTAVGNGYIPALDWTRDCAGSEHTVDEIMTGVDTALIH